MLNQKITRIFNQSRSMGWVLEPDAKQIMKSCGMDIPAFVLAKDFNTAQKFLKKINRPVVAKAVSKKIMHKTEFNAVITNIISEDHLKKSMAYLLALDGCNTVLVEEMVHGIEVIVGAKNDYQFGPVIVFGVGGTSVEIYNDTAIRMAPLKPSDVPSMVQSLKARKIITGYRGKHGVDMEMLTRLMLSFSELIMQAQEQIDSVDLNPVICTRNRCLVADARIILQ